eukprot:TRINITY_DN5809_c0_g2_i3.p3 TRINITY_DN5809_c0_g2~~TRINITY_DN5809_c0_g2_i3.p3  ORF type:complete len:211 (+),score=-5.81 TRINITY_DN5809_c0_g2_i3:1068-1700(+)
MQLLILLIFMTKEAPQQLPSSFWLTSRIIQTLIHIIQRSFWLTSKQIIFVYQKEATEQLLGINKFQFNFYYGASRQLPNKIQIKKNLTQKIILSLLGQLPDIFFQLNNYTRKLPNSFHTKLGCNYQFVVLLPQLLFLNNNTLKINRKKIILIFYKNYVASTNQETIFFKFQKLLKTKIQLNLLKNRIYFIKRKKPKIKLPKIFFFTQNKY